MKVSSSSHPSESLWKLLPYVSVGRATIRQALNAPRFTPLVSLSPPALRGGHLLGIAGGLSAQFSPWFPRESFYSFVIQCG